MSIVQEVFVAPSLSHVFFCNNNNNFVILLITHKFLTKFMSKNSLQLYQQEISPPKKSYINYFLIE